MKPLVFGPATLVASMLFVFGVPASAQEDDDLADEFALLEEEEIVFTAAKHEQDITESPSAITVIGREQIENTHCTDIVCLLRQVPEVDVMHLSPNYASVGARALSNELGNKVLLLIDGREANIDLLGLPFWQFLPIHLNDIERIEVIRGPGSALYGADAHSLLVSITTRRATTRVSEVFLGGGEHNRVSLDLRVEQPLGDFHLQAFGGLDMADHWQIQGRRERDMQRFRLRLDHQAGGGTTSVQAGLYATEGSFFTILAPGRVSGLVGEVLASYKTDLFQVQLGADVFDITASLNLPLFSDDTKIGDFLDSVDLMTGSADAQVQFNLEPFTGNLLVTGAEYRWLMMASDQNEPSESHQHIMGVFVHDEQRLGEQFVLTGGIRFDLMYLDFMHPEIENNTLYALSPRIACVWRFVDNQSLRAAFGQAFRKPSFFELNTHFKGVQGTSGFPELEEFFLRSIGNSQLDNESITALELGYTARFLEGRLILEADAFYNQYRDFVNFAVDIAYNDFGLPDLTASKLGFRNSGMEVDAVGGSLSVTYRIKQRWRANINYTFRHSWYVSDPDDSYVVVDVGAGDRVPWEPAHLLNVSFHYAPENGLRAGLALHASSAREFAIQVHGGVFDEKVMRKTSASAIVGGFLAWLEPVGPGWIELGVRVFNLLNTPFRDLTAVERSDGEELGGQHKDRRIFLFLRGGL